jgi:hypothetical protein
VLLEGLEPDLVEQYVAETGSNFKPRPKFSLPWSATPDLLPGGRDFQVQMNARAQAATNGSAAGSFELRCSGRTLRFPGGMRWIVEQLGDGAPRPMGGIIEAVGNHLDEGMVRMLIGMLVKENLAAITS